MKLTDNNNISCICNQAVLFSVCISSTDYFTTSLKKIIVYKIIFS